MGIDSSNFQPGHERLNGHRRPLLHPIEYNNLATPKPVKKTMEYKVGIIVLYVLASTLYGYITALNIQNVKGVILFAMMVIYGIGHLALLYYRIIDKKQNKRIKDLDIKEKERFLNEGSGTI